MKIRKKIEDIVFNDSDMPVSEPIVMASAAGWYVGTICKDPECGGMIVPYDRYTDYVETSEQADDLLKYYLYTYIHNDPSQE